MREVSPLINKDECVRHLSEKAIFWLLRPFILEDKRSPVRHWAGLWNRLEINACMRVRSRVELCGCGPWNAAKCTTAEISMPTCSRASAVRESQTGWLPWVKSSRVVCGSQLIWLRAGSRRDSERDVYVYMCAEMHKAISHSRLWFTAKRPTGVVMREEKPQPCAPSGSIYVYFSTQAIY